MEVISVYLAQDGVQWPVIVSIIIIGAQIRRARSSRRLKFVR